MGHLRPHKKILPDGFSRFHIHWILTNNPKFEQHLKSAYNRFQLSAGLNLNIEINFKWNQYLSRVRLKQRLKFVKFGLRGLSSFFMKTFFFKYLPLKILISEGYIRKDRRISGLDVLQPTQDTLEQYKLEIFVKKFVVKFLFHQQSKNPGDE